MTNTGRLYLVFHKKTLVGDDFKDVKDYIKTKDFWWGSSINLVTHMVNC